MRSIWSILLTARQLWSHYIGIVAGAVLTALTALLTPFIIGAATNEVVAIATTGAGSMTTIIWLAVALLAVELANTVISNAAGYLGDVTSARLRSILSARYYEKLLRLPQRYFDSQLTGSIIARLNRSITSVTDFLAMFANNFFPMLITVGAVLVITAFYSPLITVLLIVIYPLFVWLTALTSRRWQRLERLKNTDIDVAGGRFAETIGQIKVVKSFVREPAELAEFSRRYDRTVRTTRIQSRFWHAMDMARRASLNIIFFGIYLLIFANTANQQYSIGSMVLLIQLVTMARMPVTGMSYLVDTAQKAIAGSRDYFAVMQEDDEPRAPLSEGGCVPAWLAEPVPGAPMVEFRNISFGYDGGPEVLRDISLAISPGERVAFVGESGGGKTTLVNLLLRLYPQTSGHVLVAGRDTVQMSLAELRCQVGVVFQEASLFSGTIRENITYGRPDASEAEIEEAARRANAHAFIKSLPQGYDAQIGERGIKLSGGQKQRIAVARAMLKDAPILVLDEATSALDTKSERLVQSGLEELMIGRTSLIIAHRLSTISSVDTIVTLRDGRVDEVGSPDELAQTDGIYAELLALQASASRRDRRRLQRFDITG